MTQPYACPNKTYLRHLDDARVTFQVLHVRSPSFCLLQILNYSSSKLCWIRLMFVDEEMPYRMPYPDFKTLGIWNLECGAIHSLLSYKK